MAAVVVVCCLSVCELILCCRRIFVFERTKIAMAFVSGVSVTRSSRFHGARLTQRVPVGVAPVSMQMSKSVPFLPSPSKLDSNAPGFADFDPLGFSNMFDLKFLQEAEIKHGRICSKSIGTVWTAALSLTDQFL